MYKVRFEITNSANDEVNEGTKYFMDEDAAKAFAKKIKDDVDNWNKPELGGGYGGKMSTRYADTYVEFVNEDTTLDGLTLGDLRSLVMEMIDDDHNNRNIAPRGGTNDII